MKKEKKKEPYKADYRNATPEQVARAMLKYRPKDEQDKREMNTSTAGGVKSARCQP